MMDSKQQEPYEAYMRRRIKEEEDTKIKKLMRILKQHGFDYIVTRKDESICHLNVWIGEESY